MKISVVVPTYKRAHMLRTALRSIQNQSRKDLIAEIIVSENSDALESEAVCRECDRVPVKFFRQSPALRVVDHFRWLVRQAESEWVAWLADDDMWGRHHLAEAEHFLRLHPDAIAFVSESILVGNDSRTPTLGFRSTLHSYLPPHSTSYEDHWVWGREEMLVECMTQTPVNMWAMVMRKETLTAAVESLAPSNVGYESDRIFLWRIATLGKIVVGREVTTCFRMHASNASVLMWQRDMQEQERLTRQFIRQIIAEASELGIPVKETWMKAWSQLDDSVRHSILKAAGQASLCEIRKQWGDEALRTTKEKMIKISKISVLQAWVPPVLWKLLKKARAVIGKNGRSSPLNPPAPQPVAKAAPPAVMQPPVVSNPPVQGSLQGWDLVIRPTSGWLHLHLNDLWRYRDLLRMFVWRDFVAVYKQTILGPIWFFIQPLLTTATFTIIFSGVAKLSTDGLPPLLFYLAGTTPWNYFATCLTKTSTTFKDNANLFGKVYFPRLITPLAVVISTLMQFLIQFATLGIALCWFLLLGVDIHPNWAGIAAGTPALIMLLGGLGLGFGVIISALTTKYRDLAFLVTFGVQLAMYATPVVYPLSTVPEKYRFWLQLNPMTGIVEAFRSLYFGVGSFSWPLLGYSAVVTVLVLFLGILVFNKVEKTFMDTV